MTISEIWNWVTQPIISWINTKSDQAFSLYQSVSDNIKRFVSDNLGYIEDGINWVITNLFNQLNSKISDLKSGLNFVSDSIKSYLDTKLKPISQDIADTYTKLKSNFQEGLKGVAELYSDTSTLISKYFKEGLLVVSEIIAEIPQTLERLTRAGMDALASLPNIFNNFKKELFSKLDDLLTIDDEEVDKMVEEYKKKLG